ncbi:MAG: acetolactate synthase large subunit, partial [Clostridia bacterium]|nr:acetolactate synthase large subunit [Clostridia bacterium]
MRLTGAEMVIKALEKNGVKVVFGYPGAANAPIIDKMSFSSIRHILTRNEQGAAHMASGYARVTKRAGVCTATSGPGATNLITGIATAYMDSVPMVALTGQVGTALIGKDAFQEVDITGATLPFTKHSYLIKDGLEIGKVVNEAFHIAETGRPGPVLIDFPMDIL